MAVPILTQISNEGVVPLFRYWIYDFCQECWEDTDQSEWNSDYVRESYLRFRLPRLVQEQSFNLRLGKFKVQKALNDMLRIYQGCLFITLVREDEPDQTLLCDFLSETRIQIMKISDFQWIELDRTVWVDNLFSGIMDGNYDFLKKAFFETNSMAPVLQVILN